MADLYDKLTRHQVYLEGVKSWQGKDFEDTLGVLEQRLKNILVNVNGNIGDMPAAEYRKLYQRVQRQLNSTLSRSRDTMLADFKKFAGVDRKVMETILKSEASTRRRMPNQSTVENAVNRRIMGANGLTLNETVNRLYASTRTNILDRLARSRANGESRQDLVAALFGTKENPRSGLMNTLRNQARSVIATGIQHVSSVIQEYFEKIFFELYRWVSVIDEKTTDICRGRDGKVYRYGKGPIPPAHYNCRSKAVPVRDGDRRNIPASWFEWLKSQPARVLRDIVGNDSAASILSGAATSAEFPKFMSMKKIDLKQFADKIEMILAD